MISLAPQEPKLVGAMTNLRPCKGKDEAKLAAKQRTKCLNQMRACNGYVEKVLPTFENGNNNFLIISISFQAGRLQYTCKYTTDDLKKTLAQVLPRSKFRKTNLSRPDIASFIYVDRSLFTD